MATAVMLVLAGLQSLRAQGCAPVVACPVATPTYSGSPPLMMLPGVMPYTCVGSGTQQVAVYFDDVGIPHVLGGDLKSALFALGRQHMRDFPSVCALNIWRSTGRLAALVGPGVGNEYLEADFDARWWDYPKEAVRQWNSLVTSASPDLDALCAYTAGLNAGRQDLCQELMSTGITNVCGQTDAPLSTVQLANLFGEPISPIDVLCFSVRFTSFFSQQSIATLRQAQAVGCSSLSNMWAIGASARAPVNGAQPIAPMLATDPHIPPTEPGLRAAFATLHAATEGIDAGGWFVPGLPAPAMGATSATAWAATGAAVASVGVWNCQTGAAPGVPGAMRSAVASFSFGANTRSLFGQVVSIDVRDASGTSLTTSTRNLYWADPYQHSSTDWYPYPATPPDASNNFQYFSAAFLGADVSFFSFMLAMLRSQNIGDVQSAMVMNVMIEQNLLAIANDGSMAYWLAGRRPDRSAQAGVNPFQILNGHDPSHVYDAQLILPATQWPLELQLGASSTPEVWINNNVSPLLTRQVPTINPTTAAPWSLTTCFTQENYRQRRARSLLDPGPGAPGGLTRQANELALTDTLDNWADEILPYIALSYVDLLQAGHLDPAKLPAVVAFMMPLLDGTWYPRRADVDCPYAARALALRRTLDAITLHARQTWGLSFPTTIPETAVPSLLPGLNAFASQSVSQGFGIPHAMDRILMAVALECVATEEWPAINIGNPCWFANFPSVDPFTSPQLMTFPGFLLPGCVGTTPACAGMPANIPLGMIRILPVSPYTHYSLGGATNALFAGPPPSLGWTLSPGGCPGTSPTTASGLVTLQSLLGPGAAPFLPARQFILPHVLGSRSLMSIDLEGQVSIRYLSATGPSERLFSARKYSTTPCFVARELQDLMMDPVMITATGHLISTWTY